MALTDEEKEAIEEWEATLDPRNPFLSTINEDNDDDAVPDGASYMTVAAATITAFGAILF